MDEAYRLYGTEASGAAAQTYPAGRGVSPAKGGTGTFSPLPERVCHEVPFAAHGEQAMQVGA